MKLPIPYYRQTAARLWRRHHHVRLQQTRRFYWCRDLRKEPEYLGKVVTTPCPCRRYWKFPTNTPKTFQSLREEEYRRLLRTHPDFV